MNKVSHLVELSQPVAHTTNLSYTNHVPIHHWKMII